jgi:hypothetical protein
MGNARKQLFFGSLPYPHISCSLCSSNEPDTWKHVLLSCTQQHLHALCIKRHNKAVWELGKLLSCQNSRCYILMNARIYNKFPPDKQFFLGYYHVHVPHLDAIAMHVSN